MVKLTKMRRPIFLKETWEGENTHVPAFLRSGTSVFIVYLVLINPETGWPNRMVQIFVEPPSPLRKELTGVQ